MTTDSRPMMNRLTRFTLKMAVKHACAQECYLLA